MLMEPHYLLAITIEFLGSLLLKAQNGVVLFQGSPLGEEEVGLRESLEMTALFTTRPPRNKSHFPY